MLCLAGCSRGCDGPAMIVAGRGDIVTTGSGSHTVTPGNWLDAGHQAEIPDFPAADAMRMVVCDAAEGDEPEIILEPDSRFSFGASCPIRAEPSTR